MQRTFWRAPNPSPVQFRQGFHSSQSRSGSSLFNLGGLSTSRECQYLAKERRLPRTEFSPHLELIRTSEVNPHNGPGSRKRSPTEPKTSAKLVPAVEATEVEIGLAGGEALDQQPEVGLRSNKGEAQRGSDRTRILSTAAAIAALFGTTVLFSDEDLVALSYAQRSRNGVEGNNDGASGTLEGK